MSHCTYNRIASEIFILQSQSYKQYFYRKSMVEVSNIPTPTQLQLGYAGTVNCEGYTANSITIVLKKREKKLERERFVGND